MQYHSQVQRGRALLQTCGLLNVVPWREYAKARLNLWKRETSPGVCNSRWERLVPYTCLGRSERIASRPSWSGSRTGLQDLASGIPPYERSHAIELNMRGSPLGYL